MDRGQDLEGAFARAVLDAEADVPLPVVRRKGGSPARGFAVYRNNVYSSLIDVLESRFSVTSRHGSEELISHEA